MINMTEFYNEAIKNKYLDEIENEGSRTTISYIFFASKITEEILQKDLYNFTDEEVFLVMQNISPKTLNSARGSINNIRHYISWSIRNGYRENNINALDTIDRSVYSRFIDRSLKIHFSYEEFLELLSEIKNPQDRSFLFLIFEGVSGKQFSQLRDLKISDVDKDNHKIFIKETNETVDVSEECIKHIYDAYEQEIYYSYNDGEYKEKELLPSNYLFKNIKAGRTEPYIQVSMAVLYNRLNVLKSVLGMEYLTGNSIKQSGALYMAYQLFLRDGKLDKEQFYEIGYKYNVSMISDGNITYPNVTLMKEYISSENLKDLYDIDVDISFRNRTKK
jgi:integrase